jgi:hypothetical protein
MTLGLPLSTIFAFMLVLARVAGLVAFLPLPRLQSRAQHDSRGVRDGDHLRLVSGLAGAAE